MIRHSKFALKVLIPVDWPEPLTLLNFLLWHTGTFFMSCSKKVPLCFHFEVFKVICYVNKIIFVLEMLRSANAEIFNLL